MSTSKVQEIVQGRSQFAVVSATGFSMFFQCNMRIQVDNPASPRQCWQSGGRYRLQETYPLPASYLLIVPDTRDIVVSTRLRRYKRGFRDQQCTWDRRALVIVGYSKIAVYVRLVCTISSEWGKDNTVTEPVLAQFNWLEEFWNYCRRHCG